MYTRISAVAALVLAVVPALAAPTQPLYVTNNFANTFSKIDTAGNVVSTYNTVSQPLGLAFDATGSLYVTSANSETITKYAYDSSSGMPGTTGSTFADSSDGVNFPNALAFDTAQHLFVANSNTNSVLEFDGAHNLINTLSSGTSGDGPTGLAFDKNGNLFVANQLGSTITKYVPNSNGTFTVSQFTTVTSPDGLAFDKNGDLFVTRYNSTMVEYTSTNGVLSNSGAQFSTNAGLNKPYGLAFDATGDLFVANRGTNVGFNPTPGTAITEYAYSGSGLSTTGTTFNTTALNGPGFLAFAPAPSVAGAPEPSEWAALGFTGLAVGGLLLRARKRRALDA